ncbi:MAG TPA: hypothetical protein VIJ66_03865 [Solirubrobacteraceae bacterium]
MTRTRPALRRLLPQAAVLCACLAATTSARAATSATLSAKFTPEQLGQRSTLDFGFSFSTPTEGVPSPLIQIELRYPDKLGIALSGLGLATCTAQTLEAAGPPGCPRNAVMGHGQALTGIVLGSTIITETAPITIVRAPDEGGRIELLFYAEGTTPVTTRIVFPGLLLPTSAPFGGLVSIGVPLVPTLPGAPYISVISLTATLGPVGVTYYEQVGARMLAYQPRGILLPRSCPHGGFPFAAEFRFLDNASATAHTAVPCPGNRRRSGHSFRSINPLRGVDRNEVTDLLGRDGTAWARHVKYGSR